MGFDIECIIDIHNYPGEYFCPVCRTLVYPNEALQSQCTHVFCKPCLLHVANNSRACPYDGYLVTEADSKPLIQSDKAYAESIGKVKVRCLYHRSGCTWEGSLADCSLHCSACSFGNSPVICNRCGVQIVHRQVHEHAQNCPGAYQVQQAPDAAQMVLSSGLTAATGAVNLNQAASQAGAPTSQAQKSLPTPLLPGQDSNQKANANSQAPATVAATAPTADQLYQQQYQQYYQQYAGYGYDPYQQAYPQYYPYQQVAVQQYQQHPQQVLGQPNAPPYGQAAAQVQVQSSSQTQVQPQALTQHPSQPQAQPQVSVQLQAVQPPTKTQTQVQPHGAATLNSHVQPSAPASQNQPPANLQQQLPSTMQSHGQIPSQSHHGLPAPQSQHHNQTPVHPHPHPHPHPHSHSQPQPHTHPVQLPQQHVQAQYPQPPVAMHHPQPSHLHPQPQILASQPPPQPQMQPQPPLQPPLRPSQPNLPSALGSQPNQPTALGAQPSQPTALGAQLNQPTALGSQLQFMQSSGHAVSGFQSYLQPQPTHQHPISGHPAGASFPPSQMHAQALPQPPLMRPPSQGPVHNQQQGLFPPQGQVPSMPPAQQQQFHHQNPQLSYPIQPRPVIHSTQHIAQQYFQQPLSSSVQSQLSNQNQLPLQQSQQSQLHSQGPPHMMQQNSNAYPQLQQNVSMAPGAQPQPPQSYVGRPLMPNQGVQIQPQPLAQSSSGFVTGAQVKPAQFGQSEHSTNQTCANNTQNQLQTAPEQQVLPSVMTSTPGVILKQGDSVSEKGVLCEAGLSSKNATEMVANAPRVDSLELKPLKSELGMSSEQETTRESADKSRKGEPLTRDVDHELRGRKDGSLQPTGKLSLKEEHSGYSLEASDIKLTNVAKHREIIGDTRSEDAESNKSQKTMYLKSGDETFLSTTGPVNQQKSAGLPTLQTVPPPGPSSHAQVPGHAAIPARPQGFGLLPQPRLPLNPNEQFQQGPLLKQPHDVTHSGISGLGSMVSFGRGPVPFGTPQGPSLTIPLGSGDPQGGIMGGPPQNLDGEYMKLPGALERGPFGHTSGMEPNALRMNGGPGLDRSSFGSQDERFKALPREHLDHFTKDPTWPQDQGSMPLDRVPPHGSNYDTGLMRDSAGGGPTSRVQSAFHPSGGPGMVRHDMERLTPRSPDKDYLGRKAPSFGEGSRLNLPVDPQVNPFNENRFLPLPGFPWRGEHYGPEGLRFGENRAPGPHDHVRRADRFGQDIPPSHFRRGENSPNHFGAFSGHAPMGELSGPANLPHKHQYGEPFTGNKPGLPHLGEPGFRSSFSFQGFTNDGPYAGDMAHFDNTRKRKHVSMGWCRICKVDCETVEGLDMHSQTREHQKMSMDMVMSIKQQNKKKPKFLSDRAGREFGSKKRNNGPEGRGKKP